MAQSTPTSFQDATKVTARKLEVTAADFDGGCNNGASNAHGMGIAIGQAGAAGTPEQFTLLDQNGAVREPQDSAHIGDVATVPIDNVINDASGDGTVTKDGTANLETLANGWVKTAVVP